MKREVHRQVALLRVERLRGEAGLKSPTITRHLVFTGNPGTGKTTVARLVSGIYHALELLSQGQLVEVDRSELVAGYLGQTATKTAEVVASAAGGVLFIDEAYSLTGTGPAGDQYGQEAVDTLVKEMEDRRDDLVVIVAGYPAPMASFIAANPGLASRFRTTIEFEDYTDDELVAILQQLAAGADYDVLPEAVERFREVLGRTPRGDTFGNGRFARNALEAAIGHQAWRLREIPTPTLDELRQLVAQDFDEEPPGGHTMTVTRNAAAGARFPGHAPPPGSSSYAGRRAAELRGVVRAGFEGTPGRLKALGALTVLATAALRPRGRLLVPRGGRRTVPGRAPTPTSSCGCRRSRTTSSRPTPTPPTPSSSAVSSPPHSAPTTPRRSPRPRRLIAEAAENQPADGQALGVTQRGPGDLCERDRAGAGQQPPGPARSARSTSRTRAPTCAPTPCPP